MRSVDVVLAIPQLVFVLLLLSVIGPKWWLLIIAVGLSQAPQTARVVHAAAQTVCEGDFVKAVAIWGVPPRTVIRRHVLPNLTTPLMVEAGLRLSYSIVLIAGLSFLGLGEQPPAADWGRHGERETGSACPQISGGSSPRPSCSQCSPWGPTPFPTRSHGRVSVRNVARN